MAASRLLGVHSTTVQPAPPVLRETCLSREQLDKASTTWRWRSNESGLSRSETAKIWFGWSASSLPSGESMTS